MASGVAPQTFQAPRLYDIGRQAAMGVSVSLQLKYIRDVFVVDVSPRPRREYDV